MLRRASKPKKLGEVVPETPCAEWVQVGEHSEPRSQQVGQGAREPRPSRLHVLSTVFGCVVRGRPFRAAQSPETILKDHLSWCGQDRPFWNEQQSGTGSCRFPKGLISLSFRKVYSCPLHLERSFLTPNFIKEPIGKPVDPLPSACSSSSPGAAFLSQDARPPAPRPPCGRSTDA